MILCRLRLRDLCLRSQVYVGRPSPRFSYHASCPHTANWPASLEVFLNMQVQPGVARWGRSLSAFRGQHNTTYHNATQHNTTQHNTTQHNTTSRLIFYLLVFSIHNFSHDDFHQHSQVVEEKISLRCFRSKYVLQQPHERRNDIPFFYYIV